MDVDEEGTTAAAVTITTFAKAGGGGHHSDFWMRVDHPFFCAIRDDVSGTVLFAGAIYDPGKR